MPPSPEALALLSNLASGGRIRMILAEAERMEQNDPQLGPWIEQLMILARGYEMRKLRDFLQASIVQASIVGRGGR